MRQCCCKPRNNHSCHSHCCGVKNVYDTIKKVLYYNNLSYVEIPTDKPATDKEFPAYIGTLSGITNQLYSFADLTESHIKQLRQINTDPKDYWLEANRFDLIVAAVPEGTTALMNNGIGGKDVFYVDCLDKFGKNFQSNGEVKLQIDNKQYKLYGIATPASGLCNIFIE